MKNEDKKGYKSATWRRNTAYISPLAVIVGQRSVFCKKENNIIETIKI